jgi:hypothetical protein
MTPLGYRGNAGWRDMSEYAVHFTKATDIEDAYDVMLRILWDGRLRPGPNPYGAARRIPQLSDSQRSACFNEIPLDMLDRLVQRRETSYGIGFQQDFLVASGGARVWYLDNEGDVPGSFRALMERKTSAGIDTTDPFWRRTLFVDFPGSYGTTRYEFEWEREWRVPGGVAFAPEDVAFLFVPEELHGPAQSFFEDHRRENTGPSYDCPLIDPVWSIERIQGAPTTVPAFAPTSPYLAYRVRDDDECEYCAHDLLDGGICPACERLSP